MRANWNKIDFAYWDSGDVSISINEFGEGPIVLEIVNGDQSGNDWMTPDKARELAAKLIEAADAAEKAGNALP